MLSESIFGSLPCSNIIESTRLVNITMPCSALIYNALSAWFNNINYNSILILISKICFWFSIGIKLYLYILAGGHESKLGLYLQNKIVNNLTFLQITLIFFIVSYLISVTINIFILNIFNEYYFNNVDYLNDLYMVENQNKTDTKTSSNTEAKPNINISNSAGDSAIIAASMAAGTQIAKKAPTIGQKALLFSSVTAIGIGAIGIKNVLNNITEA